MRTSNKMTPLNDSDYYALSNNTIADLLVMRN